MFFKSDLKGLGTFKVETIFMTCKETIAEIGMAARHSSFGAVVNSHLNGCPDCRRHADEMSSLLSLLSAQPRVQAPADFDFRLRARIARAQSADRPSGLLENLWARTFSWGQAATALAAVALAVTFSITYFNQDNSAPVKPSNLAAVNEIPAPLQNVAGVVGEMKSQPQTVLSARPAPAKFTAGSVKSSLLATKLTTTPPVTADPVAETELVS
ncbi:MAG: anti-sigma factor family protein, partial [Blastocatellia bacterium]